MKKGYFIFLFILFLLFSLGVTVYIVRYPTEYRKEAAENKISPEPLNIKKSSAYLEGEIIVKFKPSVNLNLKKDTSRSIDQDSIPLNDFDPETLPFSLKRGRQIYKNVEKVFKGSQNPDNELGKVKQKLKEEINRGRKIDADKFLKTDLSRIYKITFNKKIQIDSLISQFKQDPQVEYVEPNFIYTAFYTPDDPYYLDTYPTIIENRDPNYNPNFDYQWNLKKINSERAWTLSQSNLSDTIAVGIIDTGVDYTNPELGGCSLASLQDNQCPKVLPGYNFVYNNSDPMDDFGHGTHVAGIIAAISNNNQGIAGETGPKNNIKILPVKVLDNNGSGLLTTVADGIKFAAENARIINLSLGGADGQTLIDSINYASSLGVSIVAAAGNSNIDVKTIAPANNPNVIAVSASDQNDKKASYSNFGEKIALAAPGSTIVSLLAANTDMYCQGGSCKTNIINNNYYFASGTSMASPHVSGAAALLLANNPSLTSTQIKNILLNSANDIETMGFDPSSGFGRLDIGKAIESMDDSDLPSASISIGNYNPTTRELSLNGIVGGSGITTYKIQYSEDKNSWQDSNLSGSGLINNGSLGIFKIPDQVNTNLLFLRLFVEDKKDTGTRNIYTTTTFSYDQTIRSGWPVNFSIPAITPNLLVADIDNDNKKEIIYADMMNINVLRENGSPQPGWPKQLMFASSPLVVGFLDKSFSDKQIVYGELVTDFINPTPVGVKINAVDSKGNMLTGFPVTVPSADLGGLTNQNLLLSDINCDGNDEIIFLSTEADTSGTYLVKIYALTARGTNLPNFPLSLTNYPYNINLIAGLFLRTIQNRGTKCPSIVLGIPSPDSLDPDSTAPAMGIINIIDKEGNLSSFSIEGTVAGPQTITADFNNDGLGEIIINNWPNLIEAYSQMGVKLWSTDTGNQEPEPPKISIGNFTQDNNLEIIVFSPPNQVMVLNAQGQIIYKSSANLPRLELGNHILENFKGIIADYSNDKKIDITYLTELSNSGGDGLAWRTLSYDNNIFIENSSLLRYVEPNLTSMAAISDIDNDEKLELVLLKTNQFFTSFYSEIVVDNLNLSFSRQTLFWPQYLHDEKHTGSYSGSSSQTTIEDLRTLLSNFINIFDYNNLIGNFGR
ncbi:MAG: S8 family peptidase [Candidatus Gottesmanbacteria bacterium]